MYFEGFLLSVKILDYHRGTREGTEETEDQL